MAASRPDLSGTPISCSSAIATSQMHCCDRGSASRSDDIQFTEGIRSGSTIVRGKGGSTRRQYCDYLTGPRMIQSGS